MRRLFSGTVATVVAVQLVLLSPSAPATAEGPYRAFPETSFWNKVVPAAAPVHPNSAKIISFLKEDNLFGYVHLSGTDATGRWGQPVYWAGNGDPEYEITSTRYKPLPPEFSSLRIPRGAKPDPTPDAEMTVYDLERGYVAGLYRAVYDSATDTWTVGGGDIFYLDSNGLHGALPQGDPRNAGHHRGLPPPSYAVRFDEIQAGAVDHVLKIGVNTTKAEAVFPMIGHENGTTHPYAPPEGARIRIKPTVDLSKLDLSPAALVIATALQRYGAIIGDQTGGPIELKTQNTIAEGRGHLWEGVVHADSLAAIPLDLYEILEFGYEPEPGVEWVQPIAVHPTKPTVKVLRPKAKVLRTGRKVTIRWRTSKSDTAFARLRYRVKGKGSRAIKWRAPDNGRFVWRAPKRLKGERVRIRVIVHDVLGQRGAGNSRWYAAR